MSRTIHINLLKNSERRSSMPIRTRVMVPAISALILVCLFVWSALLSSGNSALAANRDDIIAKMDDLKSAVADYNEIKVREAVARTEISQLESFEGGKLVVADVLASLPRTIPESMQLTSLDITPPLRPVQAKDDKKTSGGVKVAGAKNSGQKGTPLGEKVNLKLGGLVDSSASIDALRMSLRVEPFTNLIVNTEIPPGAFRISTDRSSRYIFEVNCECIERVFK